MHKAAPVDLAVYAAADQIFRLVGLGKGYVDDNGARWYGPGLRPIGEVADIAGCNKMSVAGAGTSRVLSRSTYVGSFHGERAGGQARALSLSAAKNQATLCLRRTEDASTEAMLSLAMREGNLSWRALAGRGASGLRRPRVPSPAGEGDERPCAPVVR